MKAPADPRARAHAIPISSITVADNRQRSEINAEQLQELANSIRTLGLLHPIVVRREGNTTFLVSGERRYKAIRLLAMSNQGFRCGTHTIEPGMVPVLDMGELSYEEAYEAELEENIRRVDITIQDKAKAIARLHELRKEQAAREGRVQSLMQTGMEAMPEADPEVAKNEVFKLIQVSKHLSNPDVAKAKSLHEAMKIIHRVKTAEQNRILASIVGSSSIKDRIEVYQDDAKEWLYKSAPGRFDCIIIDPPYGMDSQDFGDAAGRLEGINHLYDDSKEGFVNLLRAVAPGLTRVAKEEAHLYVWCDIDGFHFLRELFQSHGWRCFRTPLINIKRDGGRVPLPEHGPRRCYELCLYAFRGGKKVTAIYRDVFESTLESKNVGHGAQKPVEAYVELLKRSCSPGDYVLDCFAGSGPLIDAAHQLNLHAVLIEKEPAYYGLCLRRLEQLDG